jgi:DNA modification methylase
MFDRTDPTARLQYNNYDWSDIEISIIFYRQRGLFRGIMYTMETFHEIIFRSAADLSFLETGSIDLVVTSPAYPMIEMWDGVFNTQDKRIGDAIENGDGFRAFELMHKLLDPVWSECFRVLKPGAFACINIGDATRKVKQGFRLYTNHSRISSYCESIGFQSLPAILWRKQTNAPNKFMGSGMLPSGAYVTLEHEYILVFRKGDKRKFTAQEKSRRHRSAFFWEERNIWFSDVWDFKGTRQSLDGNETRQRSAAFPFELAFRLINMYSMQEDIILDPFLGTGTTTVAAMASGRNSFGAEIDDKLDAVVEQTVDEISDTITDRQLQRLKDHAAFVEEYQENRHRNLAYRNIPHGFPVMTRQEINLSIPIVTKIYKIGKAQYRACHEKNKDNTVSIVKTEGFSHTRRRETQLSLELTG